MARLYQDQAGAAGAEGGPQPGSEAGAGSTSESSSSDDDNVVDAEVEDVEDTKK
jgi:hypothetical protein